MAKCWTMSAYCFLFLLTFLTNLRPSIQQTKSEYAGYFCPSWRTYLKNSTYSSNLQSLLSSLSLVDNDFSTGFQKLSKGENPDMVYGLYLCRGDLSQKDCFVCVSHACSDILKQCRNGKEAWINYDHCMLRYADRNILLDPVTTTENVMQNQNLVVENQSDQFNKILIALVTDIVEEAAASKKKFAFKKKNYTSSQTIYALGQCTPYLTRENCSICLHQGVKNLSDNKRKKIGERLMWPSCNLRYETNLFYNESFAQLPFPPPPPQKHGKGIESIVMIIAIFVALALSTLLFIACYSFRAKRTKKTHETTGLDDDLDDIKTAGSLQFDFKAVEAATDEFSESNKLGQGGFGVVYKGTFRNGLQVAVKRLSKTSGQGEKEFRNEVIVVAKLQHKNLVRLLGFCYNREEKLLVYEFVPNKSLDYFIFDSASKSQLDWTMRYKIIGGIARG